MVESDNAFKNYFVNCKAPIAILATGIKANMTLKEIREKSKDSILRFSSGTDSRCQS